MWRVGLTIIIIVVIIIIIIIIREPWHVARWINDAMWFRTRFISARKTGGGSFCAIKRIVDGAASNPCDSVGPEVVLALSTASNPCRCAIIVVACIVMALQVIHADVPWDASAGIGPNTMGPK